MAASTPSLGRMAASEPPWNGNTNHHPGDAAGHPDGQLKLFKRGSRRSAHRATRPVLHPGNRLLQPVRTAVSRVTGCDARHRFPAACRSNWDCVHVFIFDGFIDGGYALAVGLVRSDGAGPGVMVYAVVGVTRAVGERHSPQAAWNRSLCGSKRRRASSARWAQFVDDDDGASPRPGTTGAHLDRRRSAAARTSVCGKKCCSI